MSEQEPCDQLCFPLGLSEQDRLILEMLVVDGDGAEAQEILGKYKVEVPEGENPLAICQRWRGLLINAEKYHCQNILDLHSQGKSIGGMQALATSIRKEAQ